jgi:hypothetical protein
VDEGEGDVGDLGQGLGDGGDVMHPGRLRSVEAHYADVGADGSSGRQERLVDAEGEQV